MTKNQWMIRFFLINELISLLTKQQNGFVPCSWGQLENGSIKFNLKVKLLKGIIIILSVVPSFITFYLRSYWQLLLISRWLVSSIKVVCQFNCSNNETFAFWLIHLTLKEGMDIADNILCQNFRLKSCYVENDRVAVVLIKPWK